LRTKTLLATAAAVLLLVAAACGSDDDDDAGNGIGKAAAEDDGTTTTAGDGSTTTTAPTTTEGPVSTNSELAAGPDYVTTEGPSGAGCSPGESATSLPDGWWAGEITGVQESSLDLDLVCFFSGDAAVEAAAEDGQEVDNDYYVRNNNVRSFRVTFPPSATPASCVGLDAQSFPCQVDDVLTLYGTTEVSSTSILDGTAMAPFPLVWVHITDDQGDYIYMQFTP
jgi:hypothetical protein